MAVSIAKLAIHLATDTSQMVAGFNRAKMQSKSFAASMGGTTGILGGTLLASGLAAAVVEGVRFNSSIERIRMSLTGMTQDAEAANTIIKDMMAFDLSSPLGFEDLAAGAKMLLVVGTAIEDINGQMFMLGELAAVSGKPVSELALLFGKVQADGRLMAKELNQFADAGVPLAAQLSKNLGIGMTEVRAQVEAGKISFAQFNQALVDLTTGEGMFAGQSAKFAETLAGKWSALQSQFSITAGTFTDVMTPGIKAFLEEANAVLVWAKGMVEQGGKMYEQYKWMADFIPDPLGDLDKAINGNGILVDAAAASKAREQEQLASAERNNARQAEIQAVKDKADAEAKAAADAKAAMDEMQKRADDLAKSLRTPAEVWRDSMKEVNALLEAGVLSWEMGARAVEQINATLDESLKKQAKIGGQGFQNIANPAMLRGSQEAISAVNQSRSRLGQQDEVQRRQEALLRQGNEVRAQMLAQLQREKAIKVDEVNL